jgi:hypothetical protein
VEDRTNLGLYLEMTEADPDAVEHRAGDVVRQPGVARVTWWRNVHRDRADLPRVLPEFDHLLVAETIAGFIAPEPERDFAAHNFERTPRPGQGTISGMPTIGLSLVLISPEDEARAQELRDWADFVHIRHIAEAAVPGYTMITPYVNAEPGAHPRFMHFYEMDCKDPERAFKQMTPMVTSRFGGPHHDSWKQWAHGPSLRIMYVNTFARLGELVR